MQMVPRLIEAGVGGFQGFQYEDGMDYPAICRMKARDGGPLLIKAGVSVTRTLPLGTRQDVRDELRVAGRERPARRPLPRRHQQHSPEHEPREHPGADRRDCAYYRKCR